MKQRAHKAKRRIMIPRFCIQEKTSVSTAVPCSLEKFNEMLDSERVKNICARIAQTTDDEQRSKLKRQLPGFCWHAQRFEDDKRKAAGAVPSGLAMLDVDHVADPHAWFSAWYKPEYDAWLKEKRVAYIGITPSAHGLRIVAEMQEGETIPEAQARIAQEFNIENYDAVTKDYARLSFVSPREYVLYMDEQVLFFQNEEEARNAALKGDAQEANLGASSTGHKTTEKPAMEMPGTMTAAAGDDAALKGGGVDSQEPCFKGIPYSEIVEQLMTSIGSNGGAVQGERNTVYFSLANYMRYICDFDAALLLQVLPDFGLAVDERRQAIHSALGRPRKVSMPVVLQSALSLCERAHLNDNENENENRRMGTQAQMTMPVLPPLMKMICERLPEAYRPAMVIASLPVLGALATRIRFAYLDSQEHSLSFFSCITAPAASGKSFIRQPIQLLLTPIDEQDRVEREKEQVYKERLRASKNSKNQPEDPRACPRNNGVNISIAKLLQLLTYSEGKHLIGIGEEMDTLVKSERAGVWSQKSDIYRLAFDNAEYGQAYMSDQSFSAHVPVYYNLMMTGTPNSMRRFFKDLENGLATRVCFAQLPDTSFSEIPVFAPYTEEEKQEIVRWARVLDTEKGEVRCEVVNKTIADWLEAKRQQAIECDSRAMDTFRRRSAVIGFRAGMLAYLLYGHPDQTSKKQSVSHQKEIAAFAEWVAEYVFRGQMELWGQQMEQELGGGYEQGYDAPIASLLGQLPEEFETSQLIALRAKNGQSVKTKSVAMVLSRWKQSGKVQKVADNRYKKVSN